MNGRELRNLERDLSSDLVHSDKAVLERVRAGVREFLKHEAGLLAGKTVRDEAEIIDLIQLHARVNLLRALIDNPKAFNMKDQKELFKSIGDDKRTAGPVKAIDPISMIDSLDVSAEQKAQLTQGVLEVLKERLRGQIGGK